MIRALVSLKNLTAFDTISYTKPDAVIDKALVEAVVDVPSPEATGFYFEYLPLNRKVVDQVPLNEVQVFAVSKAVPDSTAETSDDVSLSPTKRRTMIAQALDQFSRVVVFNRDVVDPVSFTEAVHREVTTVMPDNLFNATDSSVLTVTARPQDFVNSTDDFFGAQNVDDDQYMHFTKVKSIPVVTSEDDAKHISIIELDPLPPNIVIDNTYFYSFRGAWDGIINNIRLGQTTLQYEYDNTTMGDYYGHELNFHFIFDEAELHTTLQKLEKLRLQL